MKFKQGPEEFASTNDPAGHRVQPELVLESMLLFPSGHTWLAQEPNKPVDERFVPGGQEAKHSVAELLS